MAPAEYWRSRLIAIRMITAGMFAIEIRRLVRLAAKPYQIVVIARELRMLRSFVTNGMPSARAVAPIRQSHGSFE